MFWIITGILIIIIAYLIHLKINQKQTFWKDRNVPYYYVSPYENLYIRLRKKMSIAEEHSKYYFVYPDKKCYGLVFFGTPGLLIRDPDLIRNITIKDFDHFTDHMDFFRMAITDEFLMNNLLSLKGKRWHNMRTILSPSFTGNKLRGIFELMSACGEQLVHHLQLECQKQQHGAPLEIEFKDLTTRVTNDIIATTAFGIKVDSLEEPNNEFYKMGRLMTKISPFRLICSLLFPRLANLVGLSFLRPDGCKFFKQLMVDALQTRKEKNIVRPDMMNLLLEAQKEQIDKRSQLDKENSEQVPILTDTDIIAQTFIFFFAGFDTVAVAMSFVSYELAVNPDVQDKLYNEIKKVLQLSGGKIAYDDLIKMKYLDMVISESLRKWPPGIIMDRQCTKDYVLNFDDQEILIEKDIILTIPLFGLHRDEKYYPNPEKFIPERFSEKENIKPFTYMPFGMGPRQCIANRFALIEIKMFLIHLLSNFQLEVIKKTQIPFVLKCDSNNLDAKDGFWIGIKSRK